VTSAEELEALREGLRSKIRDLRAGRVVISSEAPTWAQREAEDVVREALADDLEALIQPPAPMDATERARYVNRWETGAQGKGMDRG